jgi:hypothetical protein
MHAMGYMLAAMKIGKLSMFHSDLMMTIPGAIQGSIGANSDRRDDPDSDYIDPLGSSPGIAQVGDRGRLTWGHDAGF